MKKSPGPVKKIDRSRLHLFAYASAAAALIQIGGRKFLSLADFEDRAMAQSLAPQRFIHIFLRGAWDSAFATDPVIGEKVNSGAYESIYAAQSTRTVPGKD